MDNNAEKEKNILELCRSFSNFNSVYFLEFERYWAKKFNYFSRWYTLECEYATTRIFFQK